jgi:antibiotic biosynthesis monooxygenase (ABM) superfamily enzyme
MAHLHRAARDFPRHLGGLLLAPGDDSGPWISVVRFADDAALDEWLASAQRSEALVDLNATIEGDFEQVTRRTPFGSIVRVVNGSVRTTPNWKNAMTVFMVLFPTVMLLTRFLSPVLHDWGFNPGLAMWVSNIASVALLTWLFMPWATRIFAFWLDPIDGASPRTSLIGALIVAGVCLAFLAVFLAVPWLQFWSN